MFELEGQSNSHCRLNYDEDRSPLDREALFQPVKIGNVEIKNRVAMTAMCTGYQDMHGHVTEQSKAFINARAKGGAGLIIAGSVTVTKLHADRRGSSGFKMLNTSAHAGLADMAEQAHLFGSKIFMQISTGLGRQVYHRRDWVNPELDVLSASPVPFLIIPEMFSEKAVHYYRRMGVPYMKFPDDKTLAPREATVEEIEETEETVARSVPVLKSLGFDGVEIHSSHGYFAFSFLSPRLNLRTDRYGGDLDHRMTSRAAMQSSQQNNGSLSIGLRPQSEEGLSRCLGSPRANRWSAGFRASCLIPRDSSCSMQNAGKTESPYETQ